MINNQVNLIGFVGQDVEVSNAGTSKVAKFSLATNRTWKNAKGEKQEKTEWHSLTMWGKKADIAEAYIEKGSHIAILGSIEYSSYENKDAHIVNVTTINVEEVSLLSKKK